MSLEIPPKEVSNISLILSKDIYKSNLKKNVLALDFIFEEDKEGILIKIKKCLNDACSGNKDEIITIDSTIQESQKGPNAIKETNKKVSNIMKFDIYLEKTEIKITHFEKVVYSKKFDIENLLGDSINVYLESSKDKKEKAIQNFLVCYLKGEPNPPRSLEEKEETALDHFDVDNYSIKTFPNILREGNIEAIPVVILHAKSKNGSFPSEILNYPRIKLKNLFNLVHSENESLYYQVKILDNDILLINIVCEFPGELYISSDYFKYVDKYIINIDFIGNQILDISKTYIYLNETVFINGRNSTVKIIPIDKYDNQMSSLNESDIEKFKLAAILANTTVVNFGEARFDPEEKVIIFDIILNYLGKAYIEAKYEDTIITCYRCNISLDIDGDWEQVTNINYLESIKLGEFSNLTISPKEESREISAELIYSILEIKCFLNDKPIEAISTLNKEKNIIEIQTKEATANSGNLTWQLFFVKKELNYTVHVIAEATITNLNLAINTNSLSKEITENNTEITLDVQSEFNMTYELLDMYKNSLINIDSAKIKEVKLCGNDMIPILFNIEREGNKFNISIPENNKEDFHYLVSGSNYELTLELERDEVIALFYFPVNLTSSENDTGYGNGPYNISHFTFEPNITLFELVAGEKYSFYLQLRTEKGLLYHKNLDINEHLKFNQTFDDQNFTFNVTSLNSSIGIFLIELYTTKSNENDNLFDLSFDGEKFPKKLNILIKPSPIVNISNAEIYDYTKNIYNDIDPIQIYIKLKDIYFNDIHTKNIEYKKALFPTINNEKVEFNIDLIQESKTYIISLYPDYNQKPISMDIYFNNSDEEVLIKSGLIVQNHVKKIVEPEPLAIKLSYKTGIFFLYESLKLVNTTIHLEDEPDSQKQNMEIKGDFLFFIKSRDYEKTDNGAKVALFTGYLAALQLSYYNETTGEDVIYLYDRHLIEVYSNIKNVSNKGKNYNINSTVNESVGFVKIEFYETGEIKKIYYPKKDNFNMKNMDYIRETARLIIPKVSSKLFSDDIQKQFDDLQKGIDPDTPFKERRNILLRRLSESKLKKKSKKTDKIRKRKIRKLAADVGEVINVINDGITYDEEIYTEEDIIPIEDNIGIQLREVKTNEDNSSNLTLLSLGSINSGSAKLTGSLDNSTVLTNIDANGNVNEVNLAQKSEFVSGVKDEELDEYIYGNTYDEDTAFEKEHFTAENETEMIDESSDLKIQGLENDNTNSVKLADDNFDDGTIIEYFDSTNFEEFNDTVYDNFNLESMGNDYLNDSNESYQITDEYYENNTSLRRLANSDYPYYGQKIMSTVKEVYSKSFAGITMRTYVETIVYPHNGQTLVNTKSIFGSVQKTLNSQTSYTNSHIITKNKNTMAYDLINFLLNKRSEAENYKSNSERRLINSYLPLISILKLSKPYEYETLFDDFYNGILDYTNTQINLLHENYQDIMNFLINNEKYVEGICSNNEKMINTEFNELNEISKENINRLNSFLNPVINLTINFIKEKYPNNLTYKDLILIQEISDDITNEFRANITQFISSYNNDISQLLDIGEFERQFKQFKLKTEFEQKINKLIMDVNSLFFSEINDKTKQKNIITKLSEKIQINQNYISNLFNNLKELKTKFYINKEEYLNLNAKNSFDEFLSEQYEIREDNRVTIWREYIVPVYYHLHELLFNFYQDLSDNIFYKLKAIIATKTNYEDINKQLSNITKIILNDYKLSNADITEKIKILRENILDYNRTIISFLNSSVEQRLTKLSGYFYPEKIDDNLNELVQSFQTIINNTEYFYEDTDELDYVIETVRAFKSKVGGELNDINEYTKNILKNKIFPLILEENINHINLFHSQNIIYLDKNGIRDSDFFSNSEIENLYKNFENIQTNLPKIQTEIISSLDKNLSNFNIMKQEDRDSLDDKLNSVINDEQKLIYLRNNMTFYIQHLNHSDFGEEYKNDLLKTRLEMLMDYMNLFVINSNEIYKISQFDDIFISEQDFKDITNSSYFFKKNNYSYSTIFDVDTQSDDFINNLNEALKNNVDIRTFIDDNHDIIDFDIFDINYDMVLNLSDEFFLNHTKNKFEQYNDSIYSLINEYESILYKYVDGYNYYIISFDIFEEFFDNFTTTISNKFDSIKNKTEKIKEFRLENNSNYNSNENFEDNDYIDINKIFYKNISSFINDRTQDFKDKLYSIEFEAPIPGKNKSTFIDDVVGETIYHDKLNNFAEEIVTKNTSIFINEIKKYIFELEYPIKNVFKNVTDQFLINFQNGVNISDKDREKLIDIYKNTFEFSNDNSFDRKCWNFRGIFFDEIVKEDQINYNNYLEYKQKLKSIEECEADENINCIYDRSKLEEVEYINQTELYLDCYYSNKIYTHKHSLFETMEDFDLERLKKIKSELFNILDECFYFENIILNYYYETYNLNQYKNFTEETITENFANIINETKNFIDIYMKNYTQNYIEDISSQFENIFNNLYNKEGIYKKEIEGYIDSALNIEYNIKNIFIKKSYALKYYEFDRLYKEIIQNLTVLTPSLHQKSLNFFDELLDEQEQYLDWTDEINEKISQHYSYTFPNITIDSYLSFIKNDISDIYNLSDISYYQENKDAIYNKVESKIRSSTIFSDLVNDTLNNDYKNYSYNIQFDDLSERRTRELVREKLEQINTTTFSDDQMAIKDEYNKIKNEFLNQINFKYENLNKENKIKSYMNKINQTLNDIYYMNSTLETMINKLFQTTNMTDYIENMPNFAKIFRNKSINYYKAIYSDIAKYYKLIINISNEYPLYSDYIEDKFGELSGYAIIDGLNHLDPVCQNGNCPYKIDIKNLAIENSGRRLSEKKFKKVVKEIVNILGDMRDFIKNNHYIPKDNEPLSLRKLAGLKESIIYLTTSSFNMATNIKYDSSKPGYDKKNVEAALYLLRTTFDSYNDFIYKTAQRFSEDVENSIRDKLFNLENILENKLEKYLDNLKNKIKSTDFQLLNTYLSRSYISLDNFANNMTDSISKLSEYYLDYINNKYVDNQIICSLVINKILDYYKGLEILITEKNKAIEEKDYLYYYSGLRKMEIKNVDEQKKSVEEGLKIINDNEDKIKKAISKEKHLRFGEIEDDENIPDIMKEGIDYGWDDKDSDNEKISDDEKKTNLMSKNSKRIARKKLEEAKKESHKKEEESEFKKKTKKLQEKLEKIHFEAETEITFSFKERKFAISTKAGFKFEKSLKMGWQFPFSFPVVPFIQIRIGIKAELGYKLEIGIQMDFKYEKGEADFVISFYVTFSIGIKLSVTAEAGIYTGFLDAYAGVQGILLDATAQFRFFVYFNKVYYEFYTNFRIAALQFRVYVEVLVQIKLIFWTIKIRKSLFDQSYGLTTPVFNAYYYVKLNFKSQVLEESSDARLWKPNLD